MRILFISGSSRKNGNTDTLLAALMRRMQVGADPPEIEMIRLGDQQIGMCRGCRICFDQGEDKCPHKDDIPAVAAAMRAADALVCASPVYVNDVSGLMKNWIDRLAYVCHRPSFAGVPAFVLATTGSSPTRRTVKTIQGALLIWGFRPAGSAGFKMGARMKADAMEHAYGPRLDKLAARMLRTLRRTADRQPNLIELAMFRIQQYSWSRTEADSLDYQYWSGNGFTDPKNSYFTPHHANPLSVLLARAAGTFIGWLFRGSAKQLERSK